MKMTIVSVKFGLSILVVPLGIFVLICSCTSTDPRGVDSTQASHSNNTIAEAQPYAGETGINGVGKAGLFLVVDMIFSKHTSAGEKSDRIYGNCHFKSKRFQDQKCQDVYIVVTDEKDGSQMRTWVDTNSDFEIPWRDGQKYSLVALSERFDLRSEILHINAPGDLSVIIDLDSAAGNQRHAY